VGQRAQDLPPHHAFLVTCRNAINPRVEWRDNRCGWNAFPALVRTLHMSGSGISAVAFSSGWARDSFASGRSSEISIATWSFS